MRGAVTTFPETLAVQDTGLLLEVYQAGPERLSRVLHGLTLADLTARPRPGKWSAVEIAMHVLDSELMGSVRFRFVLAQPGLPFMGYDQEIWTEHLGHREHGAAALPQVLELFGAVRRANLLLLGRLAPSDWEKWGVHPEHGQVTLRNLLELYADHSERHVLQIKALQQRLGKPLELEPLLPRPLY